MATAAQRHELVAIGNYLHLHQAQLPYLEARSADDIMSSHGMSFVSFEAFIKRGGVMPMDCSETVTTMCRWAGLKDPNGPRYNYDGYGNTETMLEFLPHFSDPREIHAGTIIVFGGPMSRQHAVIVMEKNLEVPSNPKVLSHGSNPVFIGPFSEITPGFPGQPINYLAIAGL